MMGICYAATSVLLHHRTLNAASVWILVDDTMQEPLLTRLHLSRRILHLRLLGMTVDCCLMMGGLSVQSLAVLSLLCFESGIGGRR
jgi:hypothetical protein